MFWSLIALLSASTLLGHALATNNEIHKEMTEEELRHVFHVWSHHDVPQYEVVGVHSVDGGLPDLEESVPDLKRSVRMYAFGKEMNLNLVSTRSPVTEETPVYEAEANDTGHLHYTRIDQHHFQQKHVGDTYQDEQNQAALLLHRDEDGTILMEGTIGSDLVVKPIPSSLRSKLKHHPPKKHFRRESDVKHKHIVYRRNPKEQDQFSDYAFMEPDGLPKRVRSRRSSDRQKREAPYVIYPEILVIVDYDGYRLHGGDNVQLKRYFISFWNGVDLRYKLLKGPKVRISIAGIIISRGRDATPYLERNRVGRDAIDSAAALTDMGKYLFRERRLPVYDIAVAITKYDMCRRRKGGRCTKGTAGFAYVGGACVVNKRLEKVNSVAIIEDTGGFSGIIVAAHEVGHLLGAVHDGSPPPTYLGGPGAEKCRWEDGYIMSDLRHTEKGFRWSPCSVSSFHHFLNGDTATCLYNSPHEDESLPRVLPGKLLSLDAQCRRDRGTSACFKDERVCAQLFCFDAGSGYCVAYRPAAEGSPCGDSQYCSNGRCVAEHDNIIPDYSQHTPTYILRRTDPVVGGGATRSSFIGGSNNATRRSTFDWTTTTPYSKSTTPVVTGEDRFDSTTGRTTVNVVATTTSVVVKKNHLHSFFKHTTPRTTTSSISQSTTTEASYSSESCIDKGPPGNDGLTCYDLVTKYGRQYCPTLYIRRICCAAHRYLCPPTAS